MMAMKTRVGLSSSFNPTLFLAPKNHINKSSITTTKLVSFTTTNNKNKKQLSMSLRCCSDDNGGSKPPPNKTTTGGGGDDDYDDFDYRSLPLFKTAPYKYLRFQKDTFTRDEWNLILSVPKLRNALLMAGYSSEHTTQLLKFVGLCVVSWPLVVVSLAVTARVLVEIPVFLFRAVFPPEKEARNDTGENISSTA